jgi:hypothetical protein
MTSETNDLIEFPMLWALVYVPEGMEPGQLNAAIGPPFPTTAVSLYERNQRVTCTGIALRYRPSVVRTVTGRNLNSGAFLGWSLCHFAIDAVCQFDKDTIGSNFNHLARHRAADLKECIDIFPRQLSMTITLTTSPFFKTLLE